MNYFEFFDIPVTFYPDEKELRRKYLENSKSFHPDIYRGEEQMDAVEKVTMNNQGYAALMNFDKRVQYILTEIYPEQTKTELPQEFLMEMMDVNEAVMELSMGEGDREKIEEEVAELESAIDDSIRSNIEKFEEGEEGVIEEIRLDHLKKKYFRRLKENISRE